MDEFDSVTAKVDAIFRELAGSRADALLGDQPARTASNARLKLGVMISFASNLCHTP